MPDFALRGMSPTLHKVLKNAAERNHRSLNGEILARLEASVAPALLDVDGLLARVEARRARTGILELDGPLLRELKSEGRP
ncbi:MAG: Arc family DNA-binding protein [Gemmatimonadota bacterium]|jgi:hypothetical protein